MNPASLIILGIGATLGLIGGFIGGRSYKNEYDDYMDESQEKLDDLEEKRNEQLALMDLTFETEQEKAFKEADRSDRISTQNEGFVSQDFNGEFDLLKLSMDEEAYGFNQAAVNAGQSKGNALSMAAASGTRNSSMNDAIEMEAANNAMMLQMQEDKTRTADMFNANSLIQRLMQNKTGIQNDRWMANDVREEWKSGTAQYDDDGNIIGMNTDGGSKYNIYAMQRNNASNDYQRAMDEITRERERAENNKTLGWWNAFLGGANSGFNAGTNAGTLITDTFNFDGFNNWLKNTKMNYGNFNKLNR